MSARDASPALTTDQAHPLERDIESQPFGLASIQEVLRVLISLLNPHDQQHTDTMRLMALGLLNIAFEVAGQSMGQYPSLRTMVADHLCKHLFQVSRGFVVESHDPSTERLSSSQLARSDNSSLLAASLRVIANVFDTMKPHLKLQQELFLSFLLDRLVLPAAGFAPNVRKNELELQLDRSTWAQDLVDPSERPATPIQATSRDRERDRNGGSSSDARELMLEVLSQFARGKQAATALWINYDCNIEGEDVLERLVKFLSRVSRIRPQTGSLDSANALKRCDRASTLRSRRRVLPCKIRRSSCALTRFSTWSRVWPPERTR